MGEGGGGAMVRMGLPIPTMDPNMGPREEGLTCGEVRPERFTNMEKLVTKVT